jgi:hypothetical protein
LLGFRPTSARQIGDAAEKIIEPADAVRAAYRDQIEYPR